MSVEYLDAPPIAPEFEEESRLQRREASAPSLRLAYDRARARLGLAVTTEMPIRLDDLALGWVTSDGLPYYTIDAAARAQAELDARVERVVPSDVIARTVEDARLGFAERISAEFERQKKKESAVLLSKLAAIDEQLSSKVVSRPFIAPGAYAREIDESLLRSASMESYVTYQPPAVAVSATELPAAVQLMLSKLTDKVEPEAAEMYTQSVESKRRVKLKPRGGG